MTPQGGEEGGSQSVHGIQPFYWDLDLLEPNLCRKRGNRHIAKKVSITSFLVWRFREGTY